MQVCHETNCTWQSIAIGKHGSLVGMSVEVQVKAKPATLSMLQQQLPDCKGPWLRCLQKGQAISSCMRGMPRACRHQHPQQNTGRSLQDASHQLSHQGQGLSPHASHSCEHWS